MVVRGDATGAVDGIVEIVRGQLDALPAAVELRDSAGRLVHANAAATAMQMGAPGPGDDAPGADTPGADAPGGDATTPWGALEVVDVDGAPVAPEHLPTAACLADGRRHALTVGVGPAPAADPGPAPGADVDAAADTDAVPAGDPAQAGMPARRWFRVHAAPAPLPDGAPGVLVSYLDVTAERRLEQQLKLAALHDPLTGLPNRRLLAVRFSQAQASAARSGDHLGLVYLDIDRFKGINDRHGHGAGDRFLWEFGTRLQGITRDADTAARVGGDEFVVLCTHLDSALSLQTAASRIANAVDGTVVLDGRRATIGASVGWVLVGRDMDLDASLNQADTAMYRDKARRNAT